MRRIEIGDAGGLHGGESGGVQAQAPSDGDAAGLVAPHLFLAKGAELLSILRTLATSAAKSAASGPKTDALHATVARLIGPICDHKSQAADELLLKTHILLGLREAGIRDGAHALSSSILDDTRTLRPEAEDLAPALEQLLGEARQTAGCAEHLPLFPPSVGACCTAAAALICIEPVLKAEWGKAGWKGRHVSVFGATGAVGSAFAVMAALKGADVKLVAHRKLADAAALAKSAKTQFGVELQPVRGETEEQRRNVISQTEVLLAAGPPACRIIKSEHMRSSELLTVLADTNAEPPSGVEGIEPGMNCGQIPGSIALGIGPLAIARMRHRIECQLLMQMLSSQECRPSGLWDVLTFAQRLPV